MKTLVIVGMLAGLFTLNSQANDNGDDFWFPVENGRYDVQSISVNEAEEAWQGASQRVEGNEDALMFDHDPEKDNLHN